MSAVSDDDYENGEGVWKGKLRGWWGKLMELIKKLSEKLVDLIKRYGCKESGEVRSAFKDFNDCADLFRKFNTGDMKSEEKIKLLEQVKNVIQRCLDTDSKAIEGSPQRRSIDMEVMKAMNIDIVYPDEIMNIINVNKQELTGDEMILMDKLIKKREEKKNKHKNIVLIDHCIYVLYKANELAKDKRVGGAKKNDDGGGGGYGGIYGEERYSYAKERYAYVMTALLFVFISLMTILVFILVRTVVNSGVWDSMVDGLINDITGLVSSWWD